MTFAVVTFAAGTAATIGGAAIGAAGTVGAAALGTYGAGWGALAGAGIGAGVGQLVGGNTKSTLTGAGIGATAGFGLGGGFSAGAGAGAKTGAGAWGAGGAPVYASQGIATGASAPVGIGAGTGTTAASAGSVFANPLLLGAAGLGLASAFGSQGTSFQDKIQLSPRGRQLQTKLTTATKTQMAKAKAGDVSDKAFTDISNLKKAEALRHRATQAGIGGSLAAIGNVGKEERGVAAPGGKLAKAITTEAGERMEGLFAPTSILNNYRREELFNASKAAQRLHNIDQQTAAFEYGSSLSKWQAQNILSAQKGAAIGQVASMFGSAALNQAYLGRINAASKIS